MQAIALRIGLRLMAALSLSLTVGAVADTGPVPVAVRPGVLVYADTPEQLELARWAVGRFERAGLTLPPMRIHFHGGSSGCGGRLGVVLDDRVNLCVGSRINLSSRRCTLHEIAHAWSHAEVGHELRRAFLDLRRLPTWADWTFPWDERGTEHAAEIVAWGLGDGVLTPSIPDNQPDRLAAGFRLLTGIEPPVLNASEEAGPSTTT